MTNLCFFLCLTLLASSTGAAIECTKLEQDSDKISCRMNIPYEEIANSMNINCEKAHDGIVCDFETAQSDLVTNTAKIRDCSDDGTCVQVEIRTHIGTETATASNVPAKETDSKEAEKRRGGRLKAAAANHEEVAVESGIRIGSYLYEKPYEQYAEPIAFVLKAKENIWKLSPNEANSEYIMANAFFEVGMAHLNSVVNEERYPGTYNEALDDSFDLRLTINAFQKAEKMYLGILDKYPNERPSIYGSMATLYFQWGETYLSQHFYENNADNNVDPTDLNKLSLSYFGKAEKNYRQALDIEKAKYTQEELRNMEINLAHSLHRVGRCLVSSASSVASMQGMTLHNGENVASDLLPQLQHLMTAIPKAEEKFAHASKLYHKAIEEENDFDAQNRLKNQLCYTLADASTAASYANNMPKTIELLGESIALCKEILPNLKEGSQLMRQYTGDGMYRQANNYMLVGDYESSKKAYQEAMDWFEENNLEPAAIDTGFVNSDESVEAYEKTLADYNELLLEVTIPDGYEHLMYGPNDAYEADLHAALGSAHFTRNELVMAKDHFNQAIRLYEKAMTQDNLDRSIADVKTSLAVVYFKDGDYSLSAEAHIEAMDIYQEVVGEGQNPILAGLKEKLGLNNDLNNGDISDILGGISSDLNDMLNSEELKNLVSALGPQLQHANNIQKNTVASAATGTMDQEAHMEKKEAVSSESAQSEERPSKRIHEELIDMDMIRKSIINITSMHTEL